MEDPSTSAAALKLEIARLSGAIDRHKSDSTVPTRGYPTQGARRNVYVNPNYKPPSRSSGPSSTVAATVPSSEPKPLASGQPMTDTQPQQSRDVVLGGVTFESSGRSLVRKDLPKPRPVGGPQRPAPRPPPSHASFSRTAAGHLVPGGRVYKPKSSSRGARRGPVNMTLRNTRRPFQSRRAASKRKYSDKPCPRFTTTGACSRGLTCMYQHDPSKIAICWNFLQGICPNTAETCNLSHDPTPERTPLCMHFANNGRCTRENCPFPHVRVGARSGVCRDFAVLGYCEKGIDCDKQHVRECPDFAEKGTCSTRGCKLPHVIRANRNRKPVISANPGNSSAAPSTPSKPPEVNASISTVTDGIPQQPLWAEDAQLGDEFISLTFHESESDEESEQESEGDQNDDEDHEEGMSPTDEGDTVE